MTSLPSRAKRMVVMNMRNTLTQTEDCITVKVVKTPRGLFLPLPWPASSCISRGTELHTREAIMTLMHLTVTYYRYDTCHSRPLALARDDVYTLGNKVPVSWNFFSRKTKSNLCYHKRALTHNHGAIFPPTTLYPST